VLGTVATAIKNKIDEFLAVLPVTAAVNLGVVTLTAVNTGPNANNIEVSVEAHPGAPGTTAVAAAAGVAGATVYDITTALDASVGRRYHAVALANHAAADITDAAAWLATVNGATSKKWARVYLAETGTLSTANALSTAANNMAITVLSAEDHTCTPAELAATTAAARAGQAKVNQNFNGWILAVPDVAPEASLPLDSEIESALVSGTTPITARNGKTVIVKLATTKATVSSVAYTELAGVEVVEGLYEIAERVDNALASMNDGGPDAVNASEEVRRQVAGIIYAELLQAQADGILQDVEDYKDEVRIERNVGNPARFDYTVPAAVIPGLDQLCGVVVKMPLL
jgi:phage tail sheath gpL-like